jgi:hypothetical protein
MKHTIISILCLLSASAGWFLNSSLHENRDCFYIRQQQKQQEERRIEANRLYNKWCSEKPRRCLIVAKKG